MAATGITSLSPIISSTLLRGVLPAEAKAILAASTARSYSANAVIAFQGAPAGHLYLLTSGRARYFFLTPDGKRIPLIWLTPGEAFGGAALLPEPSKYLVSTEALTDSRVLAWDRVTIRHLGARCPRLIENMLQIATGYLAWYIAAHSALISHTARQRLARVLICLAQAIGRKVREGYEIDATNEELASAANITLFTASRFMSAWQRNRALTKKRGKILLRSPERLFLHTA